MYRHKAWNFALYESQPGLNAKVAEVRTNKIIRYIEIYSYTISFAFICIHPFSLLSKKNVKRWKIFVVRLFWLKIVITRFFGLKSIYMWRKISLKQFDSFYLLFHSLVLIGYRPNDIPAWNEKMTCYQFSVFISVTSASCAVCYATDAYLKWSCFKRSCRLS